MRGVSIWKSCAVQSVKSQELKLKGAKEQWSKYDPIFAGTDVVAALGEKSLEARELKALIAQESSDLTRNPTKGDIAGIAQLGTREEKKAGANKVNAKFQKRLSCLLRDSLALTRANLTSN